MCLRLILVAGIRLLVWVYLLMNWYGCISATRLASCCLAPRGLVSEKFLRVSVGVSGTKPTKPNSSLSPA